MKSKELNVILALLVSTMLTACGGGEDSGDATDIANVMDGTGVPSVVVRTEESVNEASDAMEETAEAASEEVASAADEVATMADAAAQDAGDMGEDMSDQAEQMASDMSEQADEMVDEASDEASDEAEVAMAGAAAATGEDSASGDPCVVNVGVGDSLAFSVDNISVPSSCESVTINLEHTGSLPKEAMGHNWVLLPADSINAIGQAAMSAGVEGNYVPDDDRIVAATDLIGGGESSSVTFALSDLEDGIDYAYACTFPGHWAVMQGTFTVE